MSLPLCHRSAFLKLTAASFLFVVLAGCSDSAVKSRGLVVAAGGTLEYRGQPVADARLTFVGNDPSEPGFAVSDARGKFKCMTNDSSAGVRPGDYVVTVSLPGGGIPERYATAASSPLRIAVERGKENDFSLRLED